MAEGAAAGHSGHHDAAPPPPPPPAPDPPPPYVPDISNDAATHHIYHNRAAYGTFQPGQNQHSDFHTIQDFLDLALRIIVAAAMFGFFIFWAIGFFNLQCDQHEDWDCHWD